jgi:hypothetical protein
MEGVIDIVLLLIAGTIGIPSANKHTAGVSKRVLSKLAHTTSVILSIDLRQSIGGAIPKSVCNGSDYRKRCYRKKCLRKFTLRTRLKKPCTQ